MSVRVFAPAKINLTLKVAAPRPDGRHPLASAVAFADVGDWLEARQADGLTLAVSGPFAGDLQDEADNLVLRAARALAARFGVEAKAALKLEKNLPVASGIGGGSSDAAAALKALNALWGLKASEADLMAVAAPLGADIPVCVPARAAFMTGAGEICAPLSIPAMAAVLVNPLRPAPTGAVYRAFDSMGLGAAISETPPVWPDLAAAIAGMKALGNDLTAPAVSLVPEIADALEALRADARALYTGLSGSGATCYAIAASPTEAEALCVEIKTRRPSWWCAATRLAVG